MTALYKVTGPNLEAIHGGAFTYVPGEWTPLISPVVWCDQPRTPRGYYTTTDPTRHLAVGCRVWETEHRGLQNRTLGDKHLSESIRLTTERPDMIPGWWRSVEDFIATIDGVPWLDPQGDPDPAWRIFDTYDAAYGVARAAARLSAERATITRAQVIAELAELAAKESGFDPEGCLYFIHNGETFYDPADWLRAQQEATQ